MDVWRAVGGVGALRTRLRRVAFFFYFLQHCKNAAAFRDPLQVTRYLAARHRRALPANWAHAGRTGGAFR